MTKKQWKDAFTQGYACCLANAVQLESWNPRDISGGYTLETFKEAGVDEYDLNRLKKAMSEP